jgi:hypothetical protein
MMISHSNETSINLKLRDLAEYDDKMDIRITLNPMTTEDGEIFGVKSIDKAGLLSVEVICENKQAKGLRIVFDNAEEDIIIDEARKLRDDLLKLV